MSNQIDLLNFLAQQAIAHAALIFATLTAAFTFASGLRPKANWKSKAVYLILLFVLMSGAVYAGLRLYLYGQLATAVLNYPTEAAYPICLNPNGTPKFTGIDPHVPSNSTTYYYYCIRWIASIKIIPLINIPYTTLGGQPLPTYFLSALLGAVSAVLVTFLFVEESSSQAGSNVEKPSKSAEISSS